MELTLNTDSTTAKSLCDRTGVGNLTKHMQTRWLWLQELVKSKEISVCKVGTEFNPSDMCTKPVGAAILDKHCKYIGIVFISEGSRSDNRESVNPTLHY